MILLLMMSLSVNSQELSLTPQIKDKPYNYCFTRTQTEYLIYVMDRESLKDSILCKQDDQIYYYERLIDDKDTLIRYKEDLLHTKDQEILLQDSIISNHKEITKVVENERDKAKKEVKKYKMYSVVGVALFILSILVN